MTPQEEEIRTRAIHIAEKILSMDHFSAKLRWIYTSPLKEGTFDAETIKELHGYLSEVHHISGHLLSKLETLPPTITSQPIPVPEKEELL